MKTLSAANIAKARTLSHQISMTLASLALLIGGPLGADDTEIFVGNGSSNTGVKPNVLFILDNSGSMSGASYDENGKPSQLSRMENMKLAFEDMMRNASGLNVGLMRFNGNGGSLIYPVADIDKILEDEDELEAGVAMGMTAGSDDAIELKTTGNVFIDDDTLTLAHVPNRERNKTVTAFLAHEDDDGEEASNGSILLSDQRQFNMNNYQLNGLRYQNLNIPKGATIVSARLEFTASRYDNSHVHLRFIGEKTDNPPRFNTSFRNLSNRLVNKTASSVDWEVYGFNPWSTGSKYSSPDISPVVQELVNQADWNPNDAMVLLVQQVAGDGHRAGTLRREDTASTQGLNGSGTILHIDYHTGEVPTTDQTVGLRFDNIPVPSGATITSARIDFVSAASNVTPDGLNIQVKVENSGDAATFAATPYNLSSRSKFADVVTWHPDDAWTFAETVQGPNVTSLVQRVVNDNGDWCGGNAMAFYFEPSTATDTLARLAHAYEAGVGKKPTLTVKYTGGENGCIARDWNNRVTVRENDAEQVGNNAKADNDSSDLTLVANTHVGLRFEGVPVAQGGRVLEAYLELTASTTKSGSTTAYIRAEDSGNAPAFPQSNRNISNRNTTSNTTTWSLTPWVNNEVYRSPDLSATLNQVFARNDWSEGNALALILTGSNNNSRDFDSFDGSSGKAATLYIKAEAGAIEASTNTVRWHEIDLVNDLSPQGLTPVTGALYEAALYYANKNVDYGKDRDNSRYGRISHPGSWTGGSVIRGSGCSTDDYENQKCASEYISGSPQYTTPITSACQTSHIVLLTDGAANQNQATDKIASFTGAADCANDTSIGGEKCARTLVRWLANNDVKQGIAGTQGTVNTHTIAFNLSSPVAVDFLEDLAVEGKGGFYNVNTAQDLTTAFDTILQSVRATASTFVAPGATVNQFNRLSHRAEVYFSVFKPDSSPRWAGNLKRYKLLGNPAVISDVNDKAAVDDITGFFKDTAQSVWSTSIDGSVVAKGGASSNRPTSPTSLNMYTWLANAPTSSKNLTANVNKVHEVNANITSAMLGVADNAKRTTTLQWARGVDIKDWDGDGNTSETRLEYEDPLHSVPRIITYGGTDENPDTAIYFGTNGGYLHAINGTNGQELFSFIPESQLGKMETRFDNTANFTHPYGVDGSPVSWVHDANGDNQIQANNGDFAYLYFGLRRGGDEYFALDVTDRAAPKVLWRIEGGSGDFAELGQSWSTPTFARIRSTTGIKEVLIFGGGYDTAYDNATFAGAAATGNAIFVVDARTGERLWYASSDAQTGAGQRLSDMQYPIPADITVVDINGDGLAEQLYAADLNGQVFRFDVNTLATGAGWIHGGTIAKLSTNAAPDNRRFFNAPDVSLTSIAQQQKLAIAIGSGSRPTPLSRITQDRFYLLLQDSVFRAPGNYDVITTADLVDQTSNITNLAASDSGWFFDLPNSGEKVLSSSVTVANKIILTTYSPDSSATSCNPVVGTGRAYVLNVLNSAAAADLDEDNTIEEISDRSKTLASGNIPPSPKVLFPEDGAPTVLVGPEQPLQNVNLGLVDDWTQIYRRPEDAN